ncbi:hypothetical protein MD484_g3223, partial [Candolleomyces efflorescens]
MVITRATIPAKLRPQGNSGGGNWRCRLHLLRLDPSTKEVLEKAIIASLVPGSIDTDGLEVYMFPGEHYVLQVVGGGEYDHSPASSHLFQRLTLLLSYVHILGEFPSQYANVESPPTVIRRYKCLPEDDKKDEKGKGREDEKAQGREDDKGKARGGDKSRDRGAEQEGGRGRAAGVKIK